jgi:hypothetical protein
MHKYVYEAQRQTRVIWIYCSKKSNPRIHAVKNVSDCWIEIGWSRFQVPSLKIWIVRSWSNNHWRPWLCECVDYWLQQIQIPRQDTHKSTPNICICVGNQSCVGHQIYLQSKVSVLLTTIFQLFYTHTKIIIIYE